MSIVVNNIVKKYSGQEALKGISFTVAPGGIVGLLGPNGAGKSTIMKIICCYIPPTSGTAKVCGYSIYDNPYEVRKKVGYLPENNPLYTDMYVKEYLEFIAGIHKIKNKRKRVSEMTDLTGLGPEQNKKIGELSKGYRQRVGLAQALIHNPDVLVLDEPTSGLDPNQIIEIRELIKTIGKEKTTLLSTHIMQEVAAMCNRAIILNHGGIVADDNTAALSRLVSGKDVISVEFSTSIKPEGLLAIKGVVAARETDNHIYLIETSGNDVRPGIFEYAVNNGLTVLSMKKEEQSLEHVFQQLTKK